MAHVLVAIEDEAALTRFHRTLTQAASVGSDMIRVTTKIQNRTVFKVVRTDCPWAASVFTSMTDGGTK